MFVETPWKSINCIIDPVDGKGGIFIGNIYAARDKNLLKQLDIKAVLTVAANTYLMYDQSEVISHKIIPAEDEEGFNLSLYFNEGIEFIEKNMTETNVLVHCFAGISRSSSIVIAFLMKKNKINYISALKNVQERRPVYPNNGFAKQLKAFENEEKYEIKLKKVKNFIIL